MMLSSPFRNVTVPPERKAPVARARFIVAGLAALATPRLVSTPAKAQSEQVRLIYFPAADALPVWVAVAKGFFAQHWLSVADAAL